MTLAPDPAFYSLNCDEYSAFIFFGILLYVQQ
jgi:hypothetical protein